MKVAVTTSSFGEFSDEPKKLLQEHNIDIVYNTLAKTLTEEEALKLLPGCVGVIAGTEPLTGRLMEQLPDLRVISRVGTGLDNVDINAANAKGVIVCNTPDGPVRPVAELVLGLALDLLRKISSMDRNLRNGGWKKIMGNLLLHKNIGIVGFGRIGKEVGNLFEKMGCYVSFTDPLVLENYGTMSKMDLESLLKWADIVTLHCPPQEDGSPLLDSSLLKLMKKGAWLINAARGGLVDESSLYAALNTGSLSGAAIDVFGKEPYQGPLTELANIIVTPHIGSYAIESRVKMEIDAATNLLNSL